MTEPDISALLQKFFPSALGTIHEMPIFRVRDSVTNNATWESFVDSFSRHDRLSAAFFSSDTDEARKAAHTFAQGLAKSPRLLRRLRQDAPLTNAALAPALQRELRKEVTLDG